jgi:hypothetical protein
MVIVYSVFASFRAANGDEDETAARYLPMIAEESKRGIRVI